MLHPSDSRTATAVAASSFPSLPKAPVAAGFTKAPMRSPSLATAVAAADPVSAKPLDALHALVADDMTAVNAAILEKMDSPVALIPQLARYIVASGGKRIRPLLTLASARLCGYSGDRHVGLAAAVEFIHTATLLHDDVVDDSDMRRGKQSANAVFGNEASVLVGDFLFARAFQLMVADGSLETLRILSDAAAVIAEGEVLQLSAAHDLKTDRETYLKVIESKTAALFAAATEVGAVVADRDAADCAALRRFGQDLGVAFQLVDDVLDYSAEEAALGKAVGDDFRDGKITLPVILAYDAGSDAEKAFWRRCLEEDGIEEADLAEAQRLFARHGALEATMAEAKTAAARAEAALSRFPGGPIRDRLLDALRFTVERAY